ncbi:MAG: hypothetical protein KI790_15255 [Cyclobacteriaceae bacterium]|nr:hypothetical protein [Cyclobacteriaceae bacterium HetDA_MAG_MS6]
MPPRLPVMELLTRELFNSVLRSLTGWKVEGQNSVRLAGQSRPGQYAL